MCVSMENSNTIGAYKHSFVLVVVIRSLVCGVGLVLIAASIQLFYILK